ncbi:hypothetical protein [Nonomuraea typhae]|uniref:ESX-1 secretion-associated protein n=1 Tax=Nonomuraea typhae TaxID=2603600 RepID=A0ABW7Z6G5_9ACTN
MTGTFRLSPSGPCNDDHTRHAANTLTTAVRVLNHATLRHGTGVTSPATVYDVLGSLAAATAGLDQLLRQLGQALQHMHACGRLADDHAGRIAQAMTELDAARTTADTLADRLNQAFNATASLYLSDGSEQ